MNIPRFVPTYGEFVVHLFGAGNQAAHMCPGELPAWACPQEISLDYLTRLFRHAAQDLRYFTDREVGQGLRYLLLRSDLLLALGSTSMPEVPRIECLSAFVPMFADLFAKRCDPLLMHNGDALHSHLNPACYQWWKLLPFHGCPNDPAHADSDATALAVLEEILYIDSVAVQESALHGLAHWYPAYPDEVTGVVGRYLHRNRQLPEALQACALCVLAGTPWRTDRPLASVA